MATDYNIYSEFDIQKHKDTFIQYMECLIDENGTVHYAVPSHVEKACRMACEKLQVTRDEITALCPREFYYAWLEWLLMQTHSVAIWYDGLCGTPNQKQKAMLRKLKLAGIYRGPIEKPNR